MRTCILYITILMLICILSSSSCKDKIPEIIQPQETLPPETQEGKNTFGCLVDGKVWLPKGGVTAYRLTSEYVNRSLTVKGMNTVANEFIALNCSKIYNDTLVNIANYDSTTHYQQFYFSKEIDGSLIYFEPLKGFTGEFNLKKLDLANRILAGTFWFDGIDTTTGKIVRIRDGRFDVKY